MIADEVQEQEVEQENYFISMTDMMVGLVFIFIIIMMYYAMQLQSETARLDGSETRSVILEKLKERLEKELHVQIYVDEENGVLRLPDSILFDSGHADLKPDGRDAVQHLATALADILPCYTSEGGQRVGCKPAEHLVESVYVEGHTDTDAMGGGGLIRDNWDLSVMRATNTFRAVIDSRPELTTLCSHAPGSPCEPVLSVSGYGPQRPVDAASTDEAKRRNRRIDLRLIMVTPDSGRAAGAVAGRLAQR
jgi:chemotaxis protein MotB